MGASAPSVVSFLLNFTQASPGPPSASHKLRLDKGFLTSFSTAPQKFVGPGVPYAKF